MIMNQLFIALEIMGSGMAGIFTAILVIMAAVALLGKFDSYFSRKKG